MYITRDQVYILCDRTAEKFSKDGLGRFIDQKRMNDYQKFLESIAEERNYKEGEKIMPSDLDQIRKSVNALLDNFRSEIIEKRTTIPPTTRFTYDAHASLLAVNDYLFSTAMKTLGCPDMPHQFGFAVLGHIDSIAPDMEYLLKQEEYKKITTDKYYKNQRGRSASDLFKSTKALKDAITDKTASPLKVAKYVAEYQALKKRQEGHGAVWRFFHKKENEARTKLLNIMQKTLGSLLDDDFNIDDFTPGDIAADYNRGLVNKASNLALKRDALGKRYQISSQIFNHEATSNERAAADTTPRAANVFTEYRQQMKFEEKDFEINNDGSKEIDLSDRVIDEIPLSTSSRLNL